MYVFVKNGNCRNICKDSYAVIDNHPLIVTPRRGGYEIVSGHRRYAACQKLGVETIPVIVRDLDPDEATLCMIDSNLHREHLLPSEKAYAYKAKMEVLN
ncbi:MAG: ParB/RepB/Spo0J family partition protein, partial [Ruminococcaceae bacterium]|nr:ParB/RepB/Spo0J family partition protein [Oscillospiraceae bacterium]